MNLLHVELLVVLAPALACAVLCGVANRGALRSLFAARLKTPLLATLANRDHVNTLLSLAANLVFVGSGVGVLYGSNGDALLDQQLAALLGLLGGLLTVRLSRHAAALAKEAANQEAQAVRQALHEALEAHRCGDGMPEVAALHGGATHSSEASEDSTG